MSEKRDLVMDHLATRTVEMIDMQMDGATAIFWGDGKDQNDAWCWVLMVEAHKAGLDPIMAKTAYLEGDVVPVKTDERIMRLSAALVHSSNWENKRKAA